MFSNESRLSNANHARSCQTASFQVKLHCFKWRCKWLQAKAQFCKWNCRFSNQMTVRNPNDRSRTEFVFLRTSKTVRHKEGIDIVYHGNVVLSCCILSCLEAKTDLCLEDSQSEIELIREVFSLSLIQSILYCVAHERKVGQKSLGLVQLPPGKMPNE